MIYKNGSGKWNDSGAIAISVEKFVAPGNGNMEGIIVTGGAEFDIMIDELSPYCECHGYVFSVHLSSRSDSAHLITNVSWTRKPLNWHRYFILVIGFTVSGLACISRSPFALFQIIVGTVKTSDNIFQLIYFRKNRNCRCVVFDLTEHWIVFLTLRDKILIKACVSKFMNTKNFGILFQLSRL